MQLALTILVDGLSYASWLFIVALGLTLVFGVLKILNIAHGSFYALGAYAAASVVAWFSGSGAAPSLSLLAMLLAVPASDLLSVSLDGTATVRTRITPPKSLEKPTLSWFAGALEQLGDFAVETVDSGHDLDKQIDDVMAKLDAHPDHEGPHQTLMDLCQQAAKGFVRAQDVDPLDAELGDEADDESE